MVTVCINRLLIVSEYRHPTQRIPITQLTSPTLNLKIQQSLKKDNSDKVKVSYIRWYDEELVDDCVYLQLLIENKSNYNIMCSLSDVSINGMMTQWGTSTPIVITPGKSSRQPFMLFTKNTGVNSTADIDEVCFKVVIFDNDEVTELETSSLWKVYVKGAEKGEQ